MRLRILVLIAATLLVACGSERGVRRGDTQIVLQWVEPSNPGLLQAFKDSVLRIAGESRIENACSDVCFLDGNDIGSGTYNVYLYTRNVSETVSRMVRLQAAGKLTPGMRIAVAEYKDKQHRDWSYRPVYPPGLKSFALIYR